ncbi:helix-turn-helix domain-containing protein [Erythrobacter sp. MTPC3]|uniref:helix-turn-helix domain-containing protein n=1 Tax=Erythrobacter sp. MTPC3 TaxID=3056564 RepID=UPI0036F24CFF
MVLKAHLNPSPSVSDERGNPRREMQLQTSAAQAGAAEANVTVHNLSATGMLLETDIALDQGEMISVKLPEAGRVTAKIVWANERLYGCEFRKQLDESAIAAAQTTDMLGRARGASSARRSDRKAASQTSEPFGIRLNRLRRERSLTLAQVADALDVSKPTVWAWEKGKARPLPERMDAIADALGVSADELGDTSVSGQGAAMVQECRLRIAAEYGTDPDNVRIMIEV